MISLTFRMHSECQIRTLASVDDVADYAPLFTEDTTVPLIRWVKCSIWARSLPLRHCVVHFLILKP